MYVVFKGDIFCWNMYGHSMVIKSCNLLFFLISVVMCGLHVDYSSSAVEYTHVMWQSYFFRSIYQLYEIYVYQ